MIRSCDEPDMNNPISKRVLSRPAKCNDLESKYYRIGNFLEFCKIYEDCKIFKITDLSYVIIKDLVLFFQKNVKDELLVSR